MSELKKAAKLAHSCLQELADTGKIHIADAVKARAALTAALALPDAQPVAWLDEFGNAFPLAAHSIDGKPNWANQHKRGWKPLYAAPQPAIAPEPVKLTDEEIDAVFDLPDFSGYTEFARDVEAAAHAKQLKK